MSGGHYRVKTGAGGFQQFGMLAGIKCERHHVHLEQPGNRFHMLLDLKDRGLVIIAFLVGNVMRRGSLIAEFMVDVGTIEVEFAPTKSPFLCLQPQQLFYLWVIDEDHFVISPTVTAGHHIGEPFDRGVFVALVVLVGCAPAVDDPQKVSRRAVQRLCAPVDEDGDLAKGVEVVWRGGRAVEELRDHINQRNADAGKGDSDHLPAWLGL